VPPRVVSSTTVGILPPRSRFFGSTMTVSTSNAWVPAVGMTMPPEATDGTTPPPGAAIGIGGPILWTTPLFASPYPLAMARVLPESTSTSGT